jgi:predicted Mrr-cat superfamily restriction endonuclease
MDGMAMRAWLVRADGGKKLEDFRERSYVGIRGGDGETAVDEDLSVASDADISASVAARELGASYTRQLRAFVHEMSPGDLVVVPGPTRGTDPVVLVGRISSDYVYRPDADDLRHARAVRWLAAVPRERLPGEIWPGRRAAVSELDPRWIRDVI